MNAFSQIESVKGKGAIIPKEHKHSRALNFKTIFILIIKT